MCVCVCVCTLSASSDIRFNLSDNSDIITLLIHSDTIIIFLFFSAEPHKENRDTNHSHHCLFRNICVDIPLEEGN